MQPHRQGYCIFIDTMAEGRIPLVRGDQNLPYVFSTRIDAERDIADTVMTRLREFMEGQRDFEDAITVEEYVLEVDVLHDGTIVTEDDEQFAAQH